VRYALAVLLVLAILSVAGCGPGAASTTTSAAAPTTTAAPTTSTTSPTTSTAEAPTTATLSADPETARYVADFTAWFDALQDLDGFIAPGDDVSKLTAEDLLEAEKVVATAHDLADRLHAIECTRRWWPPTTPRPPSSTKNCWLCATRIRQGLMPPSTRNRPRWQWPAR
jgi:hypothetical protein